jgi:membrane fusion protein, copper/silver efflux system
MKSVYGVLGFTFLVLAVGVGYFWGKNSRESLDANHLANKILYYRNPMGLADTSPAPKKDSMGMDYLPVYSNDVNVREFHGTPDAELTKVIRVDSQKIQKLGVQTQAVTRRIIGRDIRALGILEMDESSLVDISPRFEGWITKLGVRTNGQRVNKGDILFEARVPDLLFREQAYHQAVQKVANLEAVTAEAQGEANNQLSRVTENLEKIGITDEEMHRLQSGGEAYSQMPFRAQINGIVIEKNVVNGSHFIAGERLFKLADLSQLWLVVQLPEQELSHVQLGDAVTVNLLTEPGKSRATKIDFIYPSLDADNRGFKIRALLDNAKQELKPGQAAEVLLQSRAHNALVISASALLDSGQKQFVLIALGDGRYQPRQVRVGERNLDWIEIIAGLNEGEQVVTSANFLLDSEARLQAVLAHFENSNKSSAHSSHSSTFYNSNASDNKIYREH